MGESDAAEPFLRPKLHDGGLLGLRRIHRRRKRHRDRTAHEFGAQAAKHRRNLFVRTMKTECIKSTGL